jgi:hypothetical protein
MKELKFVDSNFHGSLIKNIYLVLNNLNTNFRNNNFLHLEN